ncbi:MAG TPA: hypothetical protein VFX49_15530 [Chloroflexota bacterium]|nr:hypothetical protein [Chloroflexota bacterium]
MLSTLTPAIAAAPRLALRPSALLRYAIPTMAHFIFLAVIGITLTVAPKFVSADGDASRHLTVGEYILTHGIPTQDVFSFTMAGQHFVPYEWLAEVSSALSYRAAGLAGPVLLHGVVIAAACALLYTHLRRRGHALLLALPVAVLAGAASAIHWLARPHVLTFLGAVIFSRALDDWFAGRATRRSLWQLPLVMLLWVNAHGGFLIGLILLGAFVGSDVLRALAGSADAAHAARRRLRGAALPTAATLLATLANPAGPGLYAHVTGYFGKKLLVDRTQEYMSPDFHSPDFLFFVVMLVALVAGLAWSRRRLALHEGLLSLAFTYFALHSARNVPLFALILAPTLAAQLGALPRPQFGRRFDAAARSVAAWVGRRNAAYTRIEARSRGQVLPIAAVTALLAVAAAQHRGGEAPLGVRFDPTRQPVAAVQYLKANPLPGNGFNELRWGGYLLHAMWPDNRVFIDGQTDFYGEDLSREFLDVIELEPGWQKVLDRHAIQWVLLDAGTPAVRALAADPAWRVTYVDRTAAILRRVA